MIIHDATDTLTNYQDAMLAMERCTPPTVFFLQHPDLYSLGNRGTPQQIHNIYQLPIYQSSRGGQVTYHGPGQFVMYGVFDLRTLNMNVHQYVQWLETLIIRVLAKFDIKGTKGPHPGIWVNDAKIASIGIRVHRHITSHGFALNVCNDLKYFSPITVCGLENVNVTSMQQLLKDIRLRDVVYMLKQILHFESEEKKI